MLSGRLLSLLQLTRLALVFTAIADAWCNLLMLTRQQIGYGASVWDTLGPGPLLLIAGTSAGLYAFGMGLNDFIDRRRDAAIAAHRPIPSGRLSPRVAQLWCAVFCGFAFGCASTYASTTAAGWATLLLAAFTVLLIVFYDAAGKYLVAPGLITLGLIRFFQSLIAAPQMPVLWQPLLLLDHVAIVSMIAYRWEDKRPALSRRQSGLVIGGVTLLNVIVIGTVLLRRLDRGTIRSVLRLEPGLALPIAAVMGFLIVAVFIKRSAESPRVAGQRLMLAALLWLIVYDATFAAGYVSMAWGGVIALLLPTAYASVRVMRWWSTIVAISHRPAFKRVT